MTLAAPETYISPASQLARRPVNIAVIVGNRGFFPKHLVVKGRETIIEVLAKAGMNAIILDANDTDHGAVESLREAQATAEFFRAHRDQIDGVLVTLPNFGDERAIANTLRYADLNVPVLIHAFPDDATRMTIADRRDSFCGKMSACNNLRQYGIKYTLTTLHTVDPTSASFQGDLQRFAQICRVVRGMRSARLGMMGARPEAFKTVRYSEKLLERAGISVETLDLSEVFGRIDHLSDDDPAVVAKLGSIERYVRTTGVPAESLNKMSKLGVVLDRWMSDNAMDATAIQCWTSMEEFFGVVPCTIMSMASNGLMPSACETDIVGTLAMLALSLASGKPSALVDWNNNYGDDPDKGVVFHCSNLPKDVFVDEIPVMYYQEIIAGTVGREGTYGTIYGRVRENPFTYLRISTDDLEGKISAYVGEGAFTDDPIDTFGGYGVVNLPRFQDLLAYICERGYEHHVTINQTRVASAIDEAFNKYLGWATYHHR
ncbi:MAG: L-fucose/L-arabinose isomerase family protein [Chloroflexota bacterium]|nr:L-fucose/L-arabinose isomerase family protein [Chloroflexota bacterium]